MTYEDGLRAAMEACIEQRRIFGTLEYAVLQPTASIPERFACTCCIEAIERLLGDVGSVGDAR